MFLFVKTTLCLLLAFVVVMILFVVWFLTTSEDRGTESCLVTVYLSFLGALSGYFDIHFIDDSHPHGKQIIQEKWKGRGLEFLLATPTWFPLINVESVDGPVWARLRGLTLKILQVSEFKERVPEIIERVVSRYDQDTKVTNVVLGHVNIRIIWELLFRAQPTEEIVSQLYEVIELLRGTIAQKVSQTPAGQRLKKDTINLVIETAKGVENLKDILYSAQYELEFGCAVLQPFFVSPGINIADILVPALQKAEETPCIRACLEDVEMARQLVLDSIFMRHPFPILERDLTKNIGNFKKGSHVFMMNLNPEKQKGDVFCPARWGDSKFYRQNIWKVFGCGPRMCAGMQLALVWLPELLVALNERFGRENLVPWEGHKHSE